MTWQYYSCTVRDVSIQYDILFFFVDLFFFLYIYILFIKHNVKCFISIFTYHDIMSVCFVPTLFSIECFVHVSYMWEIWLPIKPGKFKIIYIKKWLYQVKNIIVVIHLFGGFWAFIFAIWMWTFRTISELLKIRTMIC